MLSFCRLLLNIMVHQIYLLSHVTVLLGWFQLNVLFVMNCSIEINVTELNWIELNKSDEYKLKVTVPVKISNRHYGFIETYKIREKFSLNQLERPVLLSFLVRCMKLRINTITTWNQKQYHIIQNWQNIGPKAYCKWTVFMKGQVPVSHNHFFIRNDLIYLNEISLFAKN